MVEFPQSVKRTGPRAGTPCRDVTSVGTWCRESSLLGTGSVLLTRLYEGSAGSVLVAVWHTCCNTGRRHAGRRRAGRLVTMAFVIAGRARRRACRSTPAVVEPFESRIANEETK